MVDMVQAIYGAKQCKETFGSLGHAADYYDKNAKFRGGSECFAELTASRNADKDKHFYNLMKQYCPKTVEIYEELMEGKRNGRID